MPDKQDIIFIVLDTQRADRLSCYNQAAPVTPHFDTLAEDATLYKHAVSPAQWTAPAHASMFTGLYPAQHTVQQIDSVLPNTIPTLAEELKKGGYQTHLFSNNPIIGMMDNGLNRGFDHVRNFIHVGFNLWSTTPDSGEKSARGLLNFMKQLRLRVAQLLGVGQEPTDTWWVNTLRLCLELAINVVGGTKFRNTRKTMDAAARVLLRSRKSHQPVFAFINLMGTHIPYEPPRWAMNKVRKPLRMPFLRHTLRWRMNYLQQNPANWLEMGYLSPEIHQTLLAFYDAEVIAQDYVLGRFVSKLQKAGRLDNSCLIVAADHGDHLGEKSRVNHVFGAYEPLIHVPLLIRDGTQQLLRHGQVNASYISTRRLFHTLLALAGIETECEYPLSLANDPLPASSVFVDRPFVEALPPQAFVQRLHRRCPQWQQDAVHEAVVYAVYDQGCKLIEQNGKHHELYALYSDPSEEEDLASIQTDQCAMLKQFLASFIAQMQPIAPGSQREHTDEEVLKRLRDLGYVD